MVATWVHQRHPRPLVLIHLDQRPQIRELYCTRTQSGNWIGFKWYRFIDQPELNQVFASLPSEKRDAAKCFMQARIERLHEAQSNGGLAAQWFDAPQGAEDLPAAKVSIDPALLLTPPQGLEKGLCPNFDIRAKTDYAEIVR